MSDQDWYCTKCGKIILLGDVMIRTGNGKNYHHPDCSQGVPLLGRRQIENDRLHLSDDQLRRKLQ